MVLLSGWGSMPSTAQIPAPEAQPRPAAPPQLPGKFAVPSNDLEQDALFFESKVPPKNSKDFEKVTGDVFVVGARRTLVSPATAEGVSYRVLGQGDVPLLTVVQRPNGSGTITYFDNISGTPVIDKPFETTKKVTVLNGAALPIAGAHEALVGEAGQIMSERDLRAFIPAAERQLGVTAGTSGMVMVQGLAESKVRVGFGRGALSLVIPKPVVDGRRVGTLPHSLTRDIE